MLPACWLTDGAERALLVGQMGLDLDLGFILLVALRECCQHADWLTGSGRQA